MTWVIAILLGLILVAMVSSNQAAAAGVWMVVRFALWGFAALIGWGALFGFWYWFYEAYPPQGDWTKTIGLLCTAIFPPIFLWLSRKAIFSAYQANKWNAIKNGLLLVAFVIASMLLGVVVREVQAHFEYGGWTMVLTPLAFCGAILTWRSATGSKGWREVWFGPPDPPEPWVVVMQEQDTFDFAENEAYDKASEKWDETSDAQEHVWRIEHQSRVTANKTRLEELKKKLEAEKTALAKANNWTVLGCFWLFFVFSAIGFIGVLWDYAFDFAMGLKFVKEQAWLAGFVVIVSALAVVGGLGSLWETFAEGTAKKNKS